MRLVYYWNPYRAVRANWKENGAENGILRPEVGNQPPRTHELLQEWITPRSQAVDLNDLESTAVDRAWLSRLTSCQVMPVAI